MFESITGLFSKDPRVGRTENEQKQGGAPARSLPAHAHADGDFVMEQPVSLRGISS